MLVFALTLALIVPAAASEQAYDRALRHGYQRIRRGQYINGSDGTLDVNAEFTHRTGIIVNYPHTTKPLYQTRTGGASYDVIILHLHGRHS